MSEIGRVLVKRTPRQLNAEEWATALHEETQRQAITYLHKVYACLLAATVGIILLQGFHTAGFALDKQFLFWLGGATIGEIGGLLMLTYRALFR